MSKEKKDKDSKKKKNDTGYFKVANASAMVAILIVGATAIYDVMQAGARSMQIPMGLSVFVALLLLAPVFSSAKNSSALAFYTPLMLFLYTTGLLMLGGWNSTFYILAGFCFCGISCIYANFRLAVMYALFQNAVIGFLIFKGFPILGQGVPLITILVHWGFSMGGIVFFLVLTHAGTFTLFKALEEQTSFRTLLATTTSYIAMVDASNTVMYTSKPLAKLAQIENAELTNGRPFMDLFPGRGLKMLVYKLLSQKEEYEESWEFSLNGQKRYFKAISTGIPGSSKSALISLHDMTHLAERDEIALMKDSLKIGLFFMDRNCIIQDQYSRYLEEVLMEDELFGKNFLDLLASSVTPKEMDAIKDYFGMMFDQVFDQAVLEDINPLTELHYVNITNGFKKVFQCSFSTVERNHGEIFALVTIYDITARVELQQRLAEEEGKRQEEMKSMFELIQVEPAVFGDFLDDAEHEFERINTTLKNNDISAHDALVAVYQSVHAIKSNAVILGLNSFGNKVHELESKIKKLREQEEEVPFDAMLNLAMELEKLSEEKEKFKTTIEKINSFRSESSGSGAGSGQSQGQTVLIESLSKAVKKASEDMEKKVNFVVENIDAEALEKGPRRIIKEVLMQLIRNSVVHGVESPKHRVAAGKGETGTIRLSIKVTGETIHVKLGDDGRGLDYDKIAEKALGLKLIKPEEAKNKGVLLKTIFSPGFSTAEIVGVHAGRGVGLNLVQDRVREGRGSIKVQTETNKGTIFNIFFPLTVAS